MFLGSFRINASKSNTVFQVLAFGLILAMIKLVYLFFNFYNILDFVVFLAAGVILSRKVSSNRWALWLLLSLPAFTLCQLLVINLGIQIFTSYESLFTVSRRIHIYFTNRNHLIFRLITISSQEKCSVAN